MIKINITVAKSEPQTAEALNSIWNWVNPVLRTTGRGPAEPFSRSEVTQLLKDFPTFM